MKKRPRSMQSALALPEPASSSSPVVLLANGLQFKRALDADAWWSVGETLQRIEQATQWWLGDWLNYGIGRKYGDLPAIAARLGCGERTLTNAAWVAGAYGFTLRRVNLSWRHHAEIAALPPRERETLLDWCLKGDDGETRPIRELRAELIRRRRIAARQAAGELPTGTYRVIYADPPWSYSDERTGLVGYEQTAATHHYPTMSTDEIAALDVAALRQPDSVLFCWATSPLLPDALQVIDAWGFTYKTLFNWRKPHGGLGHYHDCTFEHLMLATSGSCVPDFHGGRVSQLIAAPGGAHSQKPAEVRAMIQLLYEQGPYLELFARGSLPEPWVGWGNETG